MAGVTSLCLLAGCGSSDSESDTPNSLGEIRSCLDAADVPAASGGADVGLLIPVGGDRNAVVSVEDSEAEAEQQAEDWKSFGAAAGKTGTTTVNGSVWVGFPGEVDASLQQKVEDCAFE